MKVIKIKCDICGKECKENVYVLPYMGEKTVVTDTGKSTKYSLEKCFYKKNVDLCSNCENKLINFVDSLLTIGDDNNEN